MHCESNEVKSRTHIHIYNRKNERNRFQATPKDRIENKSSWYAGDGAFYTIKLHALSTVERSGCIKLAKLTLACA